MKYKRFASSKAVDRVLPRAPVERNDCPACQARMELMAATTTYKAKPWWKRMTLKHPGKKVEKEKKKALKKAADSIDSWATESQRLAGEKHVELMGERGLNLDGLPLHNHPLYADESAAGGRKRRRHRTKRRTRRGRKGRKGRETRHRR